MAFKGHMICVPFLVWQWFIFIFPFPFSRKGPNSLSSLKMKWNDLLRYSWAESKKWSPQVYLDRVERLLGGEVQPAVDEVAQVGHAIREVVLLKQLHKPGKVNQVPRVLQPHRGVGKYQVTCYIYLVTWYVLGPVVRTKSSVKKKNVLRLFLRISCQIIF